MTTQTIRYGFSSYFRHHDDKNGKPRPTAECPHYYLVPKDPILNAQFRTYIRERVTNEPEFAEEQWRMCSEDVLYWINTFGWIYEARPGASGDGMAILSRPFITWEYQDDVLLTLKKNFGRKSMFLDKSRDMGVTWMIVYMIAWHWQFFPGWSSLMISRKQDLVDSKNPDALFRKIDFIHSRMHPALLPTGRSRGDSDPSRTFQHLGNFDNEAVINGESTNPDAAAGGRQAVIFLDEFARVQGKAGFEMIDACRESTMCMIPCSTPKGTDNAYAALRDVPGIIQIKLHWVLHPRKSQGLYTVHPDGKLEILDTKWHENYEKRNGKKYDFNLDPHFPTEYRFRAPEYDNAVALSPNMSSIARNWDIDYAGTEHQIIDGAVINRHIDNHGRPPVFIGDYDHENGCFVENPNGKWKFWQPLDAYGRPVPGTYTMGVDVSLGVGASDSAISIGDAKTGEKVAEFLDNHIKPHELAQLANAVGRMLKGYYGVALMLADANGVGRTFMKEIIALEYPNLMHMKDEVAGKWKVNPKPGFYGKIARDADEGLLIEYAHKLTAGTFINPSEFAVRESGKYKATEHGVLYMRTATAADPTDNPKRHGDVVVSDMLCSKAMEEFELEEIEKKEDENPMLYSPAWFAKEKETVMEFDGFGPEEY